MIKPKKARKGDFMQVARAVVQDAAKAARKPIKATKRQGNRKAR